MDSTFRYPSFSRNSQVVPITMNSGNSQHDYSCADTDLFTTSMANWTSGRSRGAALTEAVSNCRMNLMRDRSLSKNAGVAGFTVSTDHGPSGHLLQYHSSVQPSFTASPFKSGDNEPHVTGSDDNQSFMTTSVSALTGPLVCEFRRLNGSAECGSGGGCHIRGKAQ